MAYIDRDKLMKELSTMYKSPTSSEDFMTVGYDHAIADVVVTVHEQPTADVVEVVRCKDCKWYGRVDKRRFYRGMDCLQKHIDTIVPDRDFCSKAERREK